MNTPWTSTAAELQVTVGPSETEGGLANHFRCSGADGAVAELQPSAALDLSKFDELGFSIRAARRATGEPQSPFYLEFAFVDAGDTGGESHRWLVPVNAADRWERRRIGIENDRRSAVNRFQFRVIGDAPQEFRIDDLRAVREDLLGDVEQAFVEHLGTLEIEGLTAIPLFANALLNTSELKIPPTPNFPENCQIRLRDSTSQETHLVSSVGEGNSPAPHTVLQLTTPLTNNYDTADATLTVEAPVAFAVPPGPTAVQPSLAVTLLSAEEHSRRGGNYTQRDSFRRVGDQTRCSVRRSARPYLIDLQVVVQAAERRHYHQLYRTLRQRFSMDRPLMINGFASPVWWIPAAPVEQRQVEILAPLVIRVGTRMEVEPRRQVPWVRRVELQVGRKPPPTDSEPVVVLFDSDPG